MDPSIVEKVQGGRVPDSQVTSPKRYSDEGKDAKPGVLRKKSGFSAIVNSLVGSQKKPVISAPEKATEAMNEYLVYMNKTPSDRALRQREDHFFTVSLPRKRGQTPGTTTRATCRRNASESTLRLRCRAFHHGSGK